MGNTIETGSKIDSRAKFDGGYLYLKTDKPYYYPGNNVLGKIYIRAERQMESSTLVIKVKGDEKCGYLKRVTTHSGHGKRRKSHTKIVKVNFWKDLVNYEGCCFTFNGPLMPGDYTIPFEFTLPDYSPSSLMWQMPEHYDKPKAFVNYTIEAIITNRDNTILDY